MENSREWSATRVSVGTYTFFVYINDMPEEVNTYMNLFADDVKLLKQVKNKEDCRILKEDLNGIWRWSRSGRWNSVWIKSHVVKLGRSGRQLEGIY